MIQANTINQWIRRCYAVGLILGVIAWALVACLVLASPLLLVLAIRH